MLDFAQNHEKELAKKMRDTWGKEKYWYYHRCTYFSRQWSKKIHGMIHSLSPSMPIRK